MKKEYRLPSNPHKVDFESLDLVLFLNEHLKLDSEILLHEKDFTDIILIFDFDPQDPSYSPSILEDMLLHFDDSTSSGKLFINYPMVESYKDFKSLHDPDFATSTVDALTLKTRHKDNNQYKALVNARSFVNNWNQITKTVGNYIIKSKKGKIESLLDMTHRTDIYRNFYTFQTNHFRQYDEVYIVNTSLLHLYDEYGLIATND